MARRNLVLGQAIWHGRQAASSARWPRTFRMLTALALLSSLSFLVAASPSSAAERLPAASSWTLEKTPILAGNYLTSVSCISATHCVAVGTQFGSTNYDTTLAEVWNGTSWRVQAIANPTNAETVALSGVSCTSPTACIAVGSAYYDNGYVQLPLAEAWNGKSWQVQATPAPKGATFVFLNSVSCSSASACTAVGRNNLSNSAQAVAERWNGEKWAVEATAKTGSAYVDLYGVSCTAASACTAVGDQQMTLTGQDETLAERWNGETWALQKMPLPTGSPGGETTAVSCTSATACVAVGSSGTKSGSAATLAERWNGKTWMIQATPSPAGSSVLGQVSCTSPASCIAAGETLLPSPLSYFAEVWNGVSWKMQVTPKPAGMKYGYLNGLSCLPERCVAVGVYQASSPQTSFAMAN